MSESELVGKQGVVKGAQTLGGWHEVLLEVSESTSLGGVMILLN